MRRSIKTTLFMSSFSPSLISIAAAKLWSNGFSWEAAYYALAGFLGSLTVTYIIYAIRHSAEAYHISVKKLEPNDTLLLGVVSTYFLPFIGKNSDISPLAVVMLAMAVAAVLYISNAIAPSPLMGLLGYKFYKAESASGFVYTLISKRQLIDPGQVKKVKKITATMLVEIE